MTYRSPPLVLPGLVVLLASVASVGCAYQTPAVHVPEAMPAIAPRSLDVSDVTVIDAKHVIDDATVATVRRETGAILLKASKARAELAAAGATVVPGSRWSTPRARSTTRSTMMDLRCSGSCPWRSEWSPSSRPSPST